METWGRSVAIERVKIYWPKLPQFSHKCGDGASCQFNFLVSKKNQRKSFRHMQTLAFGTPCCPGPLPPLAHKKRLWDKGAQETHEEEGDAAWTPEKRDAEKNTSRHRKRKQTKKGKLCANPSGAPLGCWGDTFCRRKNTSPLHLHLLTINLTGSTFNLFNLT